MLMAMARARVAQDPHQTVSATPENYPPQTHGESSGPQRQRLVEQSTPGRKNQSNSTDRDTAFGLRIP